MGLLVIQEPLWINPELNQSCQEAAEQEDPNSVNNNYYKIFMMAVFKGLHISSVLEMYFSTNKGFIHDWRWFKSVLIALCCILLSSLTFYSHNIFNKELKLKILINTRGWKCTWCNLLSFANKKYLWKNWQEFGFFAFMCLSCVLCCSH